MTYTAHAPDEIKQMAIDFVFGKDRIDKDWEKAKQFNNGEIVKMLKDFAIMYNEQIKK